MKPKIYVAFLFAVAVFSATHISAQCSGGRYATQIFSSYTLDSVTYSDTFSLKMDIYQPVGDTLSARPLVVLAHGGSFVSGDREDDSTILKLCVDLALKGFVTASIDYRLTSPINLLDSTDAQTEVMQSIGDFKAAVRYFTKDLYNSNLYKIDSTNIFAGGNSAGAVAAVHYGYIDSLSELPLNLQNIITANGGIHGNSGNPGYTDKIKGIISLAGGINRVSWITPCSLPIVDAQGTADEVVPYTCADAEDGAVPVILCGLGSMAPNITANTLYYDTLTFAGAGHVPWQNDLGLTGDMYQVDTLVTSFLTRALCTVTPTTCPGLTAGIFGVRSNATISVFPNPASDLVNIQSSEMITGVSLYDETGRVVIGITELNTVNYQLNTSNLSKGVYVLNIYNQNEQLPVVRKIVVE